MSNQSFTIKDKVTIKIISKKKTENDKKINIIQNQNKIQEESVNKE